MEEEPVCGICLENLTEEVAEIDSCNHRFCHPCISRWAEIETKCPFCKVRFTVVRRKALASPATQRRQPQGGAAAAAPLAGRYVEEAAVPERNQRAVFEDPTFQTWIDSLACILCGGGDHEEQLMLCDGCDRACHSYCAGHEEIPDGDWFCPQCEQRRAGTGRRRRREPAGAAPQDRGQQRRRQRRASPARGAVRLGAEAAGAGRRAGRQARQAPAPGGRSQQGRQRSSREEEEHLEGFVVASGDEEWSDRDYQARPTRRRAHNRRRQLVSDASDDSASTASAERQRGREARSDEEEEEEEEEEEAIDSETEASGSGLSSGDSLEEQPLLERLAGRARQRGQARGGAAARRPAAPAAAAAGAGRRRQRDGHAEGGHLSEEDLPREQRQVRRLADNWEALRAGRTSFAALEESAAPNAQRLRRLVRAADRDPGQAAAALDRHPARRAAAAALDARRGASSSRGEIEIISLVSPDSDGGRVSPQGRAPRRAPRSAAAAAGDVQEELAWEAAEAALGPGGSGARQRRRSRAHPGGLGAAAVALGDEDDLPLAVRLRRELAACREAGARLVPRRQTQPMPPPRRAAGVAARPSPYFVSPPGVVAAGCASPGSGRRGNRTVADLRFGSHVVRSTPGSSGGGAAGSGRRLPFAAPCSILLQDSGAFFLSPAAVAAAAPPGGPPQSPLASSNPFMRFGRQPGCAEAPRVHLNSGGNSSPQRIFDRPQQPAPVPSQHRSAYFQPGPPRRPQPSEASPLPLHQRLAQQAAARGDGARAAAAPPAQQRRAAEAPRPPSAAPSGGGEAAALGSPGGSRSRKEAILSLVKVQLRPQYDSGGLSKEQYKEAARRATRQVYCTGAEAAAMPASAVRAAVEAALASLRAQPR